MTLDRCRAALSAWRNHAEPITDYQKAKANQKRAGLIDDLIQLEKILGLGVRQL